MILQSTSFQTNICRIVYCGLVCLTKFSQLTKFFCFFLLVSFNTKCTKCFPSFFLFSVISHDQGCTRWSKFHRHRLQRRGPWSYFPELFQTWRKIRLELKKRTFSWGRWILHLNVRSYYLVQFIEHPILRIQNFNFPNLRRCKVFFFLFNITSYIGIFRCILILI